MKAFWNLLFLLLIINFSSQNLQIIGDQLLQKDFSSIIENQTINSKKNPYILYVNIFARTNNPIYKHINEIQSKVDEYKSKGIYLELNTYNNKINDSDEILLIRNGKIINELRISQGNPYDKLYKLINAFAHSSAKKVLLDIIRSFSSSEQKQKVQNQQYPTIHFKAQEPQKRTKNTKKDKNSQNISQKVENSTNKIEKRSLIFLEQKDDSPEMNNITKGICASIITAILTVGCIFIIKFSVDLAANNKQEINRIKENDRGAKIGKLFYGNELDFSNNV